MAGAETRNTSGQTVGSGGSGVDQDLFEQLPPGQFTVAGITYAFPITTIKADGENRLIERERPYRDGAKLDDTGSKARRWTLECMFQVTSRESEITTINGGLPLYPDVLNELLLLFFTHETGDLVVPTDGKVRARAQTYSRTETSGERDCALVQLVFIEDNEDSVDFRSLQAPSANANARQLASTTTFDVQSAGAWMPSLADLDQLVGALEDQVNAPGEVAGDVQSSARRIQGNAVRAGQAFKDGARNGRNLFLDPTNSRAERKLVRQRDMSARASNEARRGRPQLATVVFQESTTMFRVSATVNQAFEDLLEVNPELDPYFIPALTPINVFATQDLLNGARNSAA